MGCARSKARSYDIEDALGLVIDNTSSVQGPANDLELQESATVVVDTGTITDGTHTPKLQERDYNGSWSDVADADLVGSFSDLASDEVQKVGYIGNADEVRFAVDVSGSPTTGGDYSAVWVNDLLKDTNR